MARPTMRDHRMRRQHCGRSVAVGDSAEARNGSDRVAGKVLTGKHCKHTGGGTRCLGIDRTDSSVRMGRAQHEGMRLARPTDIVEVIAVPGDEAPVFDAPDRLTDAELLHGTSPPIRISATNTGYAIAPIVFNDRTSFPQNVTSTCLTASQSSKQTSPRGSTACRGHAFILSSSPRSVSPGSSTGSR